MRLGWVQAGTLSGSNSLMYLAKISLVGPERVPERCSPSFWSINPAALATPKSLNFTSPSKLIMTLRDLVGPKHPLIPPSAILSTTSYF